MLAYAYSKAGKIYYMTNKKTQQRKSDTFHTAKAVL